MQCGCYINYNIYISQRITQTYTDRTHTHSDLHRHTQTYTDPHILPHTHTRALTYTNSHRFTHTYKFIDGLSHNCSHTRHNVFCLPLMSVLCEKSQPPAIHPQGWTQFVCTASGRYYIACTASVLDAVEIRFYEQQCQPSKDCMARFPKTENWTTSLGERVA